MPDETIVWYQIVIAAVLTGGVVWLVARRANWPLGSTLVAACGAALLIGLWRWLANVLDLNEDFLPLISAGDAVCLLVGALAPAAIAPTIRGATVKHWLPIVAGGVGGFVINVVVL